MNSGTLKESFEFLDSWLEFRCRKLQLPGLIVAVAHKGKVVFKNAYGYANLQTHERMTPNHLFYIASQSKTFTATAIIQLAERKKLDIDDYAVKFLPWLKIHKDRRFSKITIRQLLSHGAAVIRDGLDCDFWLVEQPFPDQLRLKDMILEAELVIEPNTRMNYSNLGYGLLGMIIEAASGVSYTKYVQDNIIKPLRLNNTGPEYVPITRNKLATGYSLPDNVRKRKPIVKDLRTHALAPATGYYSNVVDLCKYYTAHFLGIKGILSNKSKNEMQHCSWVRTSANPRREYGLGLNIEYVGDRPVFGHMGWMPGHSSYTLCDPASQLVVSLFVNSIAFDTCPVALGIHSVLDYFQTHSMHIDRTRSYKLLQGRYADLWGVVEVVVLGKKIVAIYPDQWQPFDATETLEYVDGKTLKVIDAPGDCTVGYLIQYNFSKNGAVKSVRWDGQTKLPEQEYQRVFARKTKIGASRS